MWVMLDEMDDTEVYGVRVYETWDSSNKLGIILWLNYNQVA